MSTYKIKVYFGDNRILEFVSVGSTHHSAIRAVRKELSVNRKGTKVKIKRIVATLIK